MNYNIVQQLQGYNLIWNTTNCNVLRTTCTTKLWRITKHYIKMKIHAASTRLRPRVTTPGKDPLFVITVSAIHRYIRQSSTYKQATNTILRAKNNSMCLNSIEQKEMNERDKGNYMMMQKWNDETVQSTGMNKTIYLQVYALRFWFSRPLFLGLFT